MEDFEFTLKLLSPAFVAGAMTKNEDHFGKPVERLIVGPDCDGLRVPSLRGVLRFWFRAIHARQNVEESGDFKILKEKEAWLFGDTKGGQGIRIVPTGFKKEKWENMSFGVGRNGCNQAQAYLGYGPIIRDRKKKKNTSHHEFGYRDALPHKTAFTFKAIGSFSQIEELENILKVIHLLGGVGARSRRGWGALSVSPWLFESDVDEKPSAWLEENLRECLPDTLPDMPAHTSFSTGSEVGLFACNEKSWNKIFWSFYKCFQKVRVNSKMAKNDARMAKRQIDEKEISGVPKRMGFGFPYSIQFIKMDRKVEYKAQVDKYDQIDRRGSPLILSIFSDAKGALYGVGAFLKSRFWGKDDVQIYADINTLKGQTIFTTSSDCIRVDYSAVEFFMNLSKFSFKLGQNKSC